MSEQFEDIDYAEQKQKFAVYYQAILMPLLQQQEKIRRKYLHKFWWLLGLSIIFYPVLIALVIWLMACFETADVGPILLVSGLFVVLLYAPIHRYKTKVKSQIMPHFARFFGDFEYSYEQTIHDDTLQKSKLFKNFQINAGDDYFSGEYDGVKIIIAEEKLQKPQDLSVMNISYEHKQNIFRGICILLEMNKSFIGQTIGLKDCGWRNIFMRPLDLDRVRLEDSRFEKVFEVYSDNQIEARYLLTTAFMERILKLQKLYAGKNIEFSFFANQLLIAISTRQNMFETNSFFKTNLDKKTIDLAFEQFYNVCSIIKLLKLNMRIGM